MGLFDKARKLAGPNGERAKKLVAGNADKITGTLDKVTGTIDKRTAGKYRGTLDKVGGAVKKAVESADDRPSRGAADPLPGGYFGEPTHGDPLPGDHSASRDHGDGLP